MNIVRLLEYAMIALLLVAVVGQVIVPLARGRPVFPYFRTIRKTEEELAKAQEEADEAILKAQVEKLNRKKGK